MHTKKQKILIISIWILILLIGIGVGFALGKKYGTPKIQDVSKIEQGAEDFVGEFKVARVIDGDTIEIQGGERVRYIGIDAPETVEPEMPVECFGPEATAENKKLVEGQTVRLEKDLTDRDKYGRLLRYVYVGDSFINLELVIQGFARAAAYPPDTKFQDQFAAAQQNAEKTKTGLWFACPSGNMKPAGKISETEARLIAEKNCIKGGEALVLGYYNENSKTWWFDANLNATKPGCNPACVVNEETKTAEINWRCTGLITPDK